jgi:hypothetical protein
MAECLVCEVGGKGRYVDRVAIAVADGNPFLQSRILDLGSSVGKMAEVECVEGALRKFKLLPAGVENVVPHLGVVLLEGADFLQGGLGLRTEVVGAAVGIINKADKGDLDGLSSARCSKSRAVGLASMDVEHSRRDKQPDAGRVAAALPGSMDGKLDAMGVLDRREFGVQDHDLSILSIFQVDQRCQGQDDAIVTAHSIIVEGEKGPSTQICDVYFNSLRKARGWASQPGRPPNWPGLRSPLVSA